MEWLSVGRCGLIGILATRVLSILLAPAATAQSVGTANALPSTGQTTAQTIVYESGDVYLAGSRVYAFVGKTGFGHEHGVMGQLLPSKLQLDATQNAGRLDFDMRTFSADADPARKYVGLEGTTPGNTQQEVNTNMLGGAVLDVAHFPTASFVVRSASRLPQPGPHGAPQYQLEGDITFHGVARPLQVIAEAEEQGGWTHLRGGFRLVQSQFGVTPFSKAFGAVGVADEVKVIGDLWIARQRQEVAAAGAPATR